MSIFEKPESEKVLSNARASLFSALACGILAFTAHKAGVDPVAVKLLTTAKITAGLHAIVSHIDGIKTLKSEITEREEGFRSDKELTLAAQNGDFGEPCQCLECIIGERGGR